MPHVLPLDPQNMSAQKENTLATASQRSKINVSLNKAEDLCWSAEKKAAFSKKYLFILYKNLFSFPHYVCVM